MLESLARQPLPRTKRTQTINRRSIIPIAMTANAVELRGGGAKLEMDKSVTFLFLSFEKRNRERENEKKKRENYTHTHTHARINASVSTKGTLPFSCFSLCKSRPSLLSLPPSLPPTPLFTRSISLSQRSKILLQ